jgi:hypothetical protein
LVTFDAPGSAPTTTAVVFFDTPPGDFPPRPLMAASASSRVKSSSVPVTTIDMPTRFCGRSDVSGPTKFTPAARNFSMTARFASSANHAATEPAMISPTPSTDASSSSVAASMRSR